MKTTFCMIGAYVALMISVGMVAVALFFHKEMGLDRQSAMLFAIYSHLVGVQFENWANEQKK